MNERRKLSRFEESSDMGMVVDESRKPLITMRFDGVMDDTLMRAHVAAVRGILDRGKPFVLIRDPSKLHGVPTPLQRRILSEHFREDRERLARLCVGAAFVVASPLLRGALTAVLWIQPLAHPHIVVGDFGAAEAWCMARLDSTNVSARPTGSLVS